MTTQQLAQQWGQRMRARRLALGLTQHDVAKRSGLTQSAICRYERGNRRPMIDKADKLAAALDVEVSDLFAW